jgi:hypothetical protein
MHALTRWCLDKFRKQSRLCRNTFFSGLVTIKDLSTIDSFKINTCAHEHHLQVLPTLISFVPPHLQRLESGHRNLTPTIRFLQDELNLIYFERNEMRQVMQHNPGNANWFVSEFSWYPNSESIELDPGLLLHELQ